MAAQDAADAAQASQDDAIFLYRFNKVLAAGWVKPALPPENRTENKLIQSDQTDYEAAGNLQNVVQNFHAFCSTARRCASS